MLFRTTGFRKYRDRRSPDRFSTLCSVILIGYPWELFLARFRGSILLAQRPPSEIAAAALRLSQKDRMRLADTILGSLPPQPEAAEPDEILAEAIRRDAEIESSQVTPLTSQSTK